MLVVTLGCACLLHVDRAPLWCTLIVAVSLLGFWRGTFARMSRGMRHVFTVMVLGGVIYSFGTINGVAAGSALLMGMGGLKLIESRTHRDGVVVTVVALILVLSAGLDRQGLWRLPLYLIAAWLALSTIAAMGSHRAAQSPRQAFRLAGTAMLLAVPFAILAFVLVPRLPGALWSMPGSEQAQVGLSDEMNPGAISDLAVSEATAFRVRFDASIPPPEQRYWRGPVLHDFDGDTWRNERGRSPAPRPRTEFESAPVSYQITLEPHGRTWLFALDMPRTITGRRSFQSQDGMFQAFQPVYSTLIYRGTSHVGIRQPDELSTLATRRDTRLPAQRNPRSLQLARALRAEAGTSREYADRVMRYFLDGGFEYTLTPPKLDYNSIDDLLFNTRLGFCGHFASAYATLMRAGGVPARVVTGYLGGSWNAVGGYFLVRQSDAHAWTEVWLDGEGWVRFDPTSMVAPARLQRGLNELLPAARSATEELIGRSGWLRDLRDSWDAAGLWWRERIVNFNRAQQRDLLSWLGLGDIDYGGMSLLLLAGAALWGTIVTLYLRRRGTRRAGDALGRLWERYVALLARRGLDIAGHDGPEAIRRRAQRAWPQASQDIERFTSDYTKLRFGRDGAAAAPGVLPELRGTLNAIARATAARRHP
jgi:transglutaminase-like putative cysteine protease